MKRFLLLFLLFTLPAWAQSAPSKTVVVVPGRILEVKSGRYLTGQAITIEGGRVTRIGPATSINAENAQIINLPDLTVLPGLIDVHTHLTFDPNFGYQELGISIPKQALIGAKNAKITLEAGFTTVRNVGSTGYTDVALRDAINEGMLPGPRIIA